MKTLTDHLFEHARRECGYSENYQRDAVLKLFKYYEHHPEKRCPMWIAGFALMYAYSFSDLVEARQT